MATKGIIFDLGGVLLDIDYHKTEKAFTQIGAENFAGIYAQSAQNRLFDDFEEGKISANDFRAQISEIIKLDIEDREFDIAWNAMLLGFQDDRVTLIHKLRSLGIKIFLYSNIDEIHLPDVEFIIERDIGKEHFNACFDFQYYSHLFGHRKPNPCSFTMLSDDIEQRFGVHKNELLFVEDTIRHVEGALSVGIRSLHVPSNLPTNQLRSLIQAKLGEIWEGFASDVTY